MSAITPSVQHLSRHPKKPVMVWGAIFANGRRVLHVCSNRWNSATYLNVSEQSSIQKLKNEGLVFVDDNCPIHRAKIVEKWMQENGIERENWPAYSPDFNPNENVWAWMKQQMKSLVIEPENLLKVVKDLVAEVPNSFIVGLFNSMQKPVKLGISSSGFPIKY